MMMPSFLDIFRIIDYRVVFVAIILFFIGYTFAPTAYYKKYKWLTAYPFFMIDLMDLYLKKNWHPLLMFISIFLLNSTSLLVNILSAWLPGLPFLFAIWLGINIGVVMYQTLGGNLYYAALLNPVSFLELPAAWLSFTLAFQINIGGFESVQALTMTEALSYFAATLLPLLLVASILETALMVFERNHRNDDHSQE